MDEAVRQEIKKIIDGMQCPKHFRCAESGFASLCKAVDIGLNKLLECHEETPQDCPFAISFGYSYLCQCPLRVYIAKTLKK